MIASGSFAAEAQKLSIETSNPKLEQAFNWAVRKALSYVQTGKSGPVDGHERGWKDLKALQMRVLSRN